MKEKIVIFGATGQLGKAIINELSSHDYHVIGISRNLSSKRARSLAKSQAELYQVNFSKPDTIVAPLSDARKAFFLLPLGRNSERIGIAIVNSIKNSSIDHVVFSSVGGTDRKTGVTHFEIKRRIENQLIKSGKPYTILRPAAFMEEFLNIKKTEFLFSLLDKSVISTKKIQMISTTDVAKFVRKSFENPNDYIGKAIEIAGDALTAEEVMLKLSRITDKPVKLRNWPRILLPIFPKIVKEMVKFYENDGWQSDLQEMRRLHPEVLAFENIVESRSGSSTN